MKTLIVYYSNSGNNAFLAHKISTVLKADITSIQPRVNQIPFLIFCGVTKLSLGIKPLKKNLSEYERIILLGPIWAGQLITPLQDFLKKYQNQIPELYFLTSCGSGDAEKSSQFGYEGVFDAVKQIMGKKCKACVAFPIGLVLSKTDQKDPKLMMNTKLSDENFNDLMQERFYSFLEKVDQKDNVSID